MLDKIIEKEKELNQVIKDRNDMFIEKPHWLVMFEVGNEIAASTRSELVEADDYVEEGDSLSFVKHNDSDPDRVDHVAVFRNWIYVKRLSAIDLKDRVKKLCASWES